MVTEQLDQFFVSAERPEPGLTATSASFLAGLASQEVNRLRALIRGTTFYDTYLELLSGTGEARLVKKGKDKAFLDSILPTLTRIGELCGFMAYVHEAVKERDARSVKIQNCTFEQWLDLPENKAAKERMEEQGKIRRPISPASVKEVDTEWAKTQLTIRELAHYLLLEAKASALGENIHPEGTLAAAKDDLSEKSARPIEPAGVGRETTIKSYKPSIAPELVYANYNMLQQSHRSWEAELNALKAKLEIMAKNENLQRNRLYREKLTEYEKALNAYQVGVEKGKNEKKGFETQYSDWLLREEEKVRNLKIVIPHEFQSIYEYLATLGK